MIQYYEHSAKKGSVDAALTLGHIHYHGARGVPVDLDRAFRYYSKAAVAGDPAAFSQLGNMYAQGIATEQDNATALDYFRKGAAKGHPPSQNSLGYMYMHGYGVTLSHKKALEYFKVWAEALFAQHSCPSLPIPFLTRLPTSLPARPLPPPPAPVAPAPPALSAPHPPSRFPTYVHSP